MTTVFVWTRAGTGSVRILDTIAGSGEEVVVHQRDLVAGVREVADYFAVVRD